MLCSGIFNLGKDTSKGIKVIQYMSQISTKLTIGLFF